MTRHETALASDTAAIGGLAEMQRRFHRTGAMRDLEFRKRQLRTLREALVAREEGILEALRLDLGRPASEAYSSEIGVVLIARAKGRHFLVYNGADQITFDAIPPERPPDRHDRRSDSAAEG